MQAAGDATMPTTASIVPQSSPPQSAASTASIAVSATANRPAQAAIPSENAAVASVKPKRKRSVDLDGKAPSQAQPGATEEDEETESEVEMEFDPLEEQPNAQQTQQTRAETTETEQKTELDDESEEEEEEDEEFPPAPPLPSPSSSTASIASVVAAPEPPQREIPGQASSSAGANQPQPTTGVVHLQDSVDVQADGNLLRVLLSYRSRLRDASKPQSVVWDSVAAALGSRNVAVDAVKVRARLLWLQTVQRTQTHREYPRLTEPMKAMLAEVNAAMENKIQPIELNKPVNAAIMTAPRVEPIALNKRRKVALDEQTYLRIEREKLLNKQQLHQKLLPAPVMQLQPRPVVAPAPAGPMRAPSTGGSGSEPRAKAVETETAPLPVLPKQHVKSVLNVALEEKIMAIVLKHAPLFLTAEHRNDVWETIARDSRGRYESGASAKSHYVWLTQTVLSDPNHREYSKITPKLRSMCARVQSYAAKRTKISPVSKPSVSVTPVAQAQPAAVATPAPQPKPVPAKPLSAKIPAVKPPKYESSLTVAAEFDEVLMEQFLLKRPFDYDRYAKPAVWREIASLVPDPRVVSGVYGQKRVSWLADVYRNPADKEHVKLTAKLRTLLQEYTELLATGEAMSKRLIPQPRKREVVALLSTAVPGVAAGVAAATAAPILSAQPLGALPSPSETIATQRPRRQNTKRVFDEYVTMEESSDDEKGGRKSAQDPDNDEEMPMLDGEVVEASPYADEVLMREILRVRPFHKKRGEGMQLWGAVQSAVARQIGSANVFPTAERCWMRMRKLMSVVRNPKGPARVAVSSGILEMLQLLDTVLKTKWPLTAHRLKNDHHVILGRIDDILQTPFSSDPQDEAPRSENPSYSRDDGEEEDEYTQELWRDEHQPGEDDEESGEDEEKAATAVEISPEQIKMMSALGPELLDVLRPGLAGQSSEVDQTSIIPAQPEAPEAARAVEQSETTQSPEGAVETPTKSMEEQVQSCVRQLEVQAKTIEQERDQHRVELRTLVEMLKDERERHRRDEAAMLAVIKQEREDRKSEFVAMMNLITRSVLPAEPPSH